MFQTPQPGDVITVTTRYRNHYYKRVSDYVEETHENVEVQRPFSWLSTFEFCIAAELQSANIEVIEKLDRAPKFDSMALRYGSAYTPNNVSTFSTRVIHMKNVVAINGKKVENKDFSTKEVDVPSSKGGFYIVRVEGGIGTSCECKGFQFRQNCRHLKEAENK